MFEGILRDKNYYIVKVGSEYSYEEYKLNDLQLIIHQLYENEYMSSDVYSDFMELCDQSEVEPEIIELHKRKLKEKLKIYLIKKNPKSYYEKIYSDWLSSIKQFTFQGGLGYSFSCTGSTRTDIHHQCIMPKYYQKAVDLITDEVLISCLALDKFISFSSKSSEEKWGN